MTNLIPTPGGQGYMLAQILAQQSGKALQQPIETHTEGLGALAQQLTGAYLSKQAVNKHQQLGQDALANFMSGPGASFDPRMQALIGSVGPYDPLLALQIGADNLALIREGERAAGVAETAHARAVELAEIAAGGKPKPKRRRWVGPKGEVKMVLPGEEAEAAVAAGFVLEETKPLVNIGNEVELTAAVNKANRANDTHKGLQLTADAALQENELFDRYLELQKHAQVGMTAPIRGAFQALMKDIGLGEFLDLDNDADFQQALRSLENEMTLTQTQKLKGPISEKELGFLGQIPPSLKNTELGNLLIIETKRKANIRASVELDLADEWDDRYGHIGKRDENGRTYRQMIKQYRIDNPVFGPEDVKRAKAMAKGLADEKAASVDKVKSPGGGSADDIRKSLEGLSQEELNQRERDLKREQQRRLALPLPALGS